MHPAVAALVSGAVDDLDTAGSELAGCRIDIIDQEADNGPGGKVPVHLGVGSEDLDLASVRQLEHLKPGKIKVGLEAEDVLKEINGRPKVVGAGTNPRKLDDVHVSS